MEKWRFERQQGALFVFDGMKLQFVRLQISINALLLGNLKTWYCVYGLVTQDVPSEQEKSTDNPRSIAYLGCPWQWSWGC